MEGDKPGIWTQGCLTWIELIWHIQFWENSLFYNLQIYLLDSHLYLIRKSQSLFHLSYGLTSPWHPAPLTNPWPSTIIDVSVITKNDIYKQELFSFHCRHIVNMF